MADKKDKVDHIHEAICNVMSKVQAIKKEGFNAHFKYNFRSFEQVINTLQPIFVECGVYPTSDIEIVSVENGMVTALCEYTLHSKVDGSSVSTKAIGQGKDNADKGGNKAMSTALKYAYGQLFMIPFEGDDPEDSRDDASNYKTPPKKSKAPPKSASKGPVKIDGSYQVKVGVGGAKKALNDCDEDDMTFVLENLRAAEATGGSNSELAGKLADICVGICKIKGFKHAPF